MQVNALFPLVLDFQPLLNLGEYKNPLKSAIEMSLFWSYVILAGLALGAFMFVNLWVEALTQAGKYSTFDT
jgi:hypothetical protein